MEKEFVPYEQALALKELGFDEECFMHYGINDISLFKQFGKIDFIKNSQLTKFEVSAPLYQQCWRWFREKYSMASFIQRFEGNVFDYEINSSIFKEVTDFEDGYFDTYEEAELACLKKLIEIVKNK